MGDFVTIDLQNYEDEPDLNLLNQLVNAGVRQYRDANGRFTEAFYRDANQLHFATGARHRLLPAHDYLQIRLDMPNPAAEMVVASLLTERGNGLVMNGLNRSIGELQQWIEDCIPFRAGLGRIFLDRLDDRNRDNVYQARYLEQVLNNQGQEREEQRRAQERAQEHARVHARQFVQLEQKRLIAQRNQDRQPIMRVRKPNMIERMEMEIAQHDNTKFGNQVARRVRFNNAMGNVRLRASDPTKNKPLNNFVNIEYVITDNCFLSWFESHITKNCDYKKILGHSRNYYVKNGIDTNEIFLLAEEYCFNVNAYDDEGDIFKSYKAQVAECFEQLTKTLNYVVHNSHFYVVKINKVKPKKKEIRLKKGQCISFKQLLKLRNTNIIFEEDNVKEYDILCKKIKKHTSSVQYSPIETPFETNTIKYCSNHSVKLAIQKDLKCLKKKNLYTAFNSIFKLKGFLNSNLLNYLRTNCNNVNIYKAKLGISDYRYDMNKAYIAPLLKEDTVEKDMITGMQICNYVKIPIPNIDDDFTVYKQGDTLYQHGLYYVKIKSSKVEPTCFLGNGLYFYDQIKRGIDDGIIKLKNIKLQLVTEKHVSIKQSDLNKILDKVRKHDCKLRTFISYIGWLGSVSNYVQHTFDNIEGLELEAKLIKYGADCHYIKDKKRLIVTKEYKKWNSGLLANMYIKSHTNLKLYDFNKQFIKLNPTAKLNTIHTDSIGYILKEKVIEPELINLNKIGYFKSEAEKLLNERLDKDKRKKAKSGDLITKIKSIPKPNMHNINSKIVDGKRRGARTSSLSDKQQQILAVVDSSYWKQVIKANKNCLMDAGGGLGKSYTMHKMIDYLIRKGKAYKLASSTKENVLDHIKKYPEHGCCTLDSLFKKSDKEIINEFEKINYLFVDEVGQLTQQSFKKIEFIKSNTNCKIILAGDSYQCYSVDAPKRNWISGLFVKKLTDFNQMSFKWSKHSRCSKKLYKLLEEVKQCKNKKGIFKLLEKRLKKKQITFIDKYKEIKNIKTKTINNISFTNDVSKALIKKGNVCSTIHSFQGKTIYTPFTIHMLHSINANCAVIYTALSRGVKLKHIYLQLFKNY